jgi:glycosyltransferase involved in cell wall biosynthesis
MKLSIITINYNNAEGLRKTLVSVAAQTYADIEHIIVDGGSTDNSVEVIREYEQSLTSRLSPLASRLKWISEPDKGIYNAMNKGIRMATGEYIEILNSGDILFDSQVTQRMIEHLDQINAERKESLGIIYGNITKVNAQGQVVGKSGYTEYSLRQFYSSTLNHDCAYIRRDLFEEYGLYDENLKIVSDWKWYLQAIGLGRVKPEYVDIDVTIFDDGGVSETNLALRNAERRKVLEELLPPAVLWDYDTHAFEMEQMKRLRRWHLYGLVWFIERVCFKLEKWFRL